jgi:hypothetical protein
MKSSQIRSLVAATLCLLVFGLISSEARPAGQERKPLLGTVTRGGLLTLRDAAGRTVTRLRVGSYVVTVRDRSSRQNFHLVGPRGIDRKTGLKFVGMVKWTLSFHGGTYRYSSDKLPTSGRSFRVAA